MREHIDEQRQPTTSLFQDIRNEQEQAFWEFMDAPQKWDPCTYNCSHWAAQAWVRTTEQDLETSHNQDIMGDIRNISSPIGLEDYIQKIELSPSQGIKISEKEQENTKEQPQAESQAENLRAEGHNEQEDPEDLKDKNKDKEKRKRKKLSPQEAEAAAQKEREQNRQAKSKDENER